MKDDCINRLGGEIHSEKAMPPGSSSCRILGDGAVSLAGDKTAWNSMLTMFGSARCV